MDAAAEPAAHVLSCSNGALDGPENHPLAGVFEDWAWLSAWTAKWLREERVRKKREQRRAQRARRRGCRSDGLAPSVPSRGKEVLCNVARRDCDQAWRGQIRREARQRRERLREEARLQDVWAKEEIDDDTPEASATPPVSGFCMSLDRSPVFSRTASPSSTGTWECSSTASRQASAFSSPGFGPCLGITIGPMTWATWARQLASRHQLAKPLFGATPVASPQSLNPQPEPQQQRPRVPALGMCALSLPPPDIIDEDFSRSEGDDDVVKHWYVSLEGANEKANQQISDLLHEFIGPEDFCRFDAAGSLQSRLLNELIQARGSEPDLDVDVWGDVERHAVEQILEGGSQSIELAKIPEAAMRRLLATRGYKLPEPQIAQTLGKGSFGRVLKVRRTRDDKLFAVKRQFLGDFADDVVPVLRETSILNVLKGACNVVQIEDAFLMRPSKGAAEVWSVLEHFPHNLYKVRHRFRSPETSRRMVFQVLLGLHSLHSADIVHRDLKPDNVLVDLGSSPPRTIRVALCDFNTSRSVHGFAPELPSTAEIPELFLPTEEPLERKVTDRVTTSWWRAPEMWGWADTRQMTKRDLKSLDIFALGLVWAELLAVKSVLEYWEGVDPPKFRLLEILQKVDRPTDADLNELGFSDDVSCFIRCVLAGNMEALKPELISPVWPKNQESREEFLKEPYLGIRAWVLMNAWQSCLEDSPSLDMIASMARFSYRERPTVGRLLANPLFSDLRADTPPKIWSHREAPHFADVREALRAEHKRQGLAANRARELRELRGGDGANVGEPGARVACAQDAFLERLAANTAADVEESVRNVCARVRTALEDTARLGPRSHSRSRAHLDRR